MLTPEIRQNLQVTQPLTDIYSYNENCDDQFFANEPWTKRFAKGEAKKKPKEPQPPAKKCAAKGKSQRRKERSVVRWKKAERLERNPRGGGREESLSASRRTRYRVTFIMVSAETSTPKIRCGARAPVRLVRRSFPRLAVPTNRQPAALATRQRALERASTRQI